MPALAQADSLAATHALSASEAPKVIPTSRDSPTLSSNPDSIRTGIGEGEASAATPAEAAVNRYPGSPAVGRNADGHLEVFQVGADGELRHRWQKLASGDWSSWSSLGGALHPDITVASNAKGQLEVFGVDRVLGQLNVIWQRPTNSAEWSSSTSLGGAIQAPVAVGQNADGRLEVFAVEAGSGTVKHLVQRHASMLSVSGAPSVEGLLSPALSSRGGEGDATNIASARAAQNASRNAGLLGPDLAKI